MRLQRLLPVATLVALFGTLLVACASANPGWTYQPAPSVTVAPSVEASTEPSATAGSGSGGVAITASALAFDPTEITAPAGEPFQIEFSNKDAGTPHNVAIHKDSPTGAEVFKGDIFNGVETRTYEVPALDAGTYAFVCTVHPTMVGTLTAE
jgi:plastocyanin